MVGAPLGLSSVGWRFDNSYARLPEIMLSQISPVPVKTPKLIILNCTLCKELGLDFSSHNDGSIASVFAGNSFPQGSQFIAQAYAGHQFGHFTILGDGRAILMGEHLTLKNNRYDIQLKGSGRTPYSRDGDGRAAIGPVLREYIISEAMYGLGVPTTRSLAAVTTGEDVIRESSLPGAILTRVAASHIRVGTFQYLTVLGNIKILKYFVNYTINRHYPNINNSSNPALALLRAVIEKQIDLITNWMRVGFIHGVMNTDNMAISGETIDYGPCAFMNSYNPKTVFSSIDHHGRYSYGNQPSILHWNLLRFAETLLPIINKNQDKAVEIVKEVFLDFASVYKKSWLKMMRKKLGLLDEISGDETLITTLLTWMEESGADYTNTFQSLLNKDILNNKMFRGDEFFNWYQLWQKRLTQNKKPAEVSFNLMQKTNPLIIPRNHKVEEALNAASSDYDLIPMHNLLNVLKTPYEVRPGINVYESPPRFGDDTYKTFCGT